MSATNTTTNYNLPIFLSSDKPAWLVDFNGAMNAIDAQMKVNADAIATKSPILTFADTTDIDFTVTSNTVEASLTTGIAGTISRSILKPAAAPAQVEIPYVDTSNAQQMLTLGTGLSLSSGVLNAIDLNFVNFENTTSFTTVTGSNITIATGSNINLATNASRTIGKVYGMITVTKGGSNERIQLRTPLQVVAPPSQIYISCAGVGNVIEGGGSAMSDVAVIIDTSGYVNIEMSAFAGANRNRYLLFPCLYFFKDFGDTPI